MGKKILSGLLAFAMAVSLLAGIAMPVKAEETTGEPAAAEDASTISGTVLDADGNPKSGVMVTLRDRSAADGTGRTSVTTGEDGTYTASVAAGEYQIVAIPYEFDNRAADKNNAAADYTQVCAVAQNVTAAAGETAIQDLRIPTEVEVPNGEFESTSGGWTFGESNSTSVKIERQPSSSHSGTNRLKMWVASDFTVDVYQTLDLDEGTYVINAAVSAAITGTDELYIYAKDSSGKILAKENITSTEVSDGASMWEIIGLTVEVSDSPITVGVSGSCTNSNNGSWANLDEFRMGKLPTVVKPEIYTKDQLKTLLEEAAEIEETAYTKASYEAFAEAMTAAQSVYENAGATETQITEAYKTLQAAKEALVPAATSETPDIQNDVFWKTTDGDYIYSQGGGIFKFGDTYYWYGVKYEEAEKYVKNPSVYYTNSDVFAGITCYTSKDLVNWKYEGIVVKPEEVSGHADMNGKDAVWVGRLGVAYVKTGENTGTYALLVQHECEDTENGALDAPDMALESDGKTYWSKQVLVLTSDTPDGEFQWNQRINMYDYTGGTSNTGDQTVFTDEDTGKSYLVYSYGRGRGKIFLSEIISQQDGKIGLGTSHMIYNGTGREGNCMFKYGGKYYVCASDLFGWNASHAYYLTLESLEDSYLESADFKPATSMKLMDGCSDDYCHVSQTGFFYTVQGSEQETVIFCGDRWADFAGNGLGYNQWCPLSFNNAGEPYFNSVSAWNLDAATGKWSVHDSNNYVKNGSFDADRVASTSLTGWKNTIEKGTSPINNINDTVTGKYALKLGDATDFSAKISQTIASTEYVKLPNGYYDLTAKVKNSGAFDDLRMYVKSGDMVYQCAITENHSEYTEITVKGAAIFGGTAEVGFMAEGSANAYCCVDDVTLVRSEDQEMQTGKITGTVKSDTSKTLLVEAVAADGMAYSKEIKLTTEAAGTSYTLDSVKPGTYTLTFSANSSDISGNSQSVTVTAGGVAKAEEVTVTNKGGNITGKVKDETGSAVADAIVKLEKDGSVIETVTGADGTYSIDDVIEGTYTLTVEKSGYVTPESVKVTVTKNETTSVADQTMVHTIGTVKGTVLDASGQPAEGVTVYLRSNSAKSDTKRYTAVTDASGAYSVEVIADQYQIVAVPYEFDDRAANLTNAAVDNTKVCAVVQKVTVAKDSTVTEDLQIPAAVTVPNGEFETDTDWIVDTGSSGAGVKTGESKNNHSGNGRLRLWAGSNFSFDVHQTLTELSEGSYVINAAVSAGTAAGDTLYLYVKDAEGNMITQEDIANTADGKWEIIGLEVEIETADSPITVGVYGECIGGSWANIDEFRLGKIPTKAVPDTKEELQQQLEELIEQEEAFKNSVEASSYTAGSWKTFTDALEAAIAVRDNTDADITAIQQAIANLNSAKRGLQGAGGSVTVSKDALQNAVTTAKSYQKADYTADSYAALQTAITEAEEVLKNDMADADEITAAALKLAQAIEDLVPLSEEVKEAIQAKEELQTAVSSAEEQIKDLKPEDCTKIAWDTLQQELEAVKGMDETAGKENLAAAKERIENAVTAVLASVQAKKDLQAAITAAQAKKEADYEPESWKAYQDALQAAQAAIISETATADSLKSALSTLNSVELQPKKNNTTPGGDKDQNQEPGEDNVAASITLSQGKITIGVKEKVQLTAVVKNAAGKELKGQKIKWSFNKKGVVTVSAAGKITAKKVGKTTITAQTENGKTAKCVVTVKKAVKSIKLPKKQITLKKGKTYTIKPKLSPTKSGTYQITYTSNKKKVATVSAKGKIKAVKKGKATITVRTHNKKKATIKVTVN